MTRFICIECRAEVIGNEPPHELKVTRGNVTTVELRCKECADGLAWAFWCEETMGPNPFAGRHKAGHS